MTSSVLVSLRIAATPVCTFEVFTREIGAWWRPNRLFGFTPGPPGRLSFEAGVGGRFLETAADGAVFEIGRVVAWEPGRRLAFTWRQASFAPGLDTEVEVRFEPVGEETRVTVEHRGWDRVPQDSAVRHGFPDATFLQRYAEWWRSLLAAVAMEFDQRT